MKIGVFGGTFDPIHFGHLIAAEEARTALELDSVLFVPAGNPWFKADWYITPARHRMAMVDLAIESNHRFQASEIEVRRNGPTYTVDTLVELHRRLGDDTDLYVILGADALSEIDRWHQPIRLFELATIVGVARPGGEGVDLRRLDAITPGTSELVLWVEGSHIDISATDIRRRVAQGMSIKYRVPESVEAYIYENILYVASR